MPEANIREVPTLVRACRNSCGHLWPSLGMRPPQEKTTEDRALRDLTEAYPLRKNGRESETLTVRWDRHVRADPTAFFAVDVVATAEAAMQNARRLAATKVEISLDQVLGAVRIRHDGSGLARAKARRLAIFATSKPPARPVEVFAFVSTGAVMRSQDWRLEIPRGVDETGHMRLDPRPKIDGFQTVLRIDGTEDPDRRKAIAAVFSRAAAAMPFDTIVDGSRVRNYRPEDQLRSADGRPMDDDRVVHRIRDWTITTARFENGRRRWIDPPRHEAVPAGWLTLACDISGRIVRPDLNEIAKWHPALSTPAETRLLIRADERHVEVEPAYIAILKAERDLSHAPHCRSLDDLFGKDGPAIADALVESIAELVSRAPRNAVTADHPLRSAGSEMPPPQVFATRPRRRNANTPSGKAEEGFLLTGLERGALIVSDNGSVVYRDPVLRDGLTVVPSFGPVFSEILAATPAGSELVDMLVETNGRMPDLDEVVGADLVVNGVHHVIACGTAFADADVAAKWLAGGLPRGLAKVRRLAVAIRRRYGATTILPLRHACIVLDGRPTVLTPGHGIEAIASALVNIVPWRRPETDDAELDLALFRRRTTTLLRHAFQDRNREIGDR